MHRATCSRLLIRLALFLLLALPLSALAQQFKVIYTFQANSSTDGAWPEGQLIRDAKGNLYGTTVAGGVYGAGTVFELSPSSDGTWTETIIYSFTGTSDGEIPVAGVVFDKAGNLYGTTQQGGNFGTDCRETGCGVVFELSPADNGWTYTLLYSFTGKDGAGPNGTLAIDAHGNLFGVTGGGGVNEQCYGGCGLAFELVRANNWHEKVLHVFQNFFKDGAYPSGGLVFDESGNLYGTTVVGGLGGAPNGAEGTVYELSPAAGPWTETILHSFCSEGDYCNDGNAPTGTPVLQGNTIFGAAYSGGNPDGGSVFRLVNENGDWHLTYFDLTQGQGPMSPVLPLNGNIFGVAQTGGIANGACAQYPNGNGVVWELSPQNGSMTETVLYSFTGASDGCGPAAGLTADSEGNLYGTTFEGGSSANGGTVFEVTP